MLKINLMPPHLHRRKQVRLAVVVVTALVAGEVVGFIMMSRPMMTNLQQVKSSIEQEKSTYAQLTTVQTDSTKLTEEENKIKPKFEFIQDILAYNKLTPDLYEDISGYIYSGATALSMNAALTQFQMTAYISNAADISRLMLVLARSKKVVGLPQVGGGVGGYNTAAEEARKRALEADDMPAGMIIGGAPGFGGMSMTSPGGFGSGDGFGGAADMAGGPGMMAGGPGMMAGGPGMMAGGPGMMAGGPGMMAGGPGMMGSGGSGGFGSGGVSPDGPGMMMAAGGSGGFGAAGPMTNPDGPGMMMAAGGSGGPAGGMMPGMQMDGGAGFGGGTAGFGGGQTNGLGALAPFDIGFARKKPRGYVVSVTAQLKDPLTHTKGYGAYTPGAGGGFGGGGMMGGFPGGPDAMMGSGGSGGFGAPGMMGSGGMANPNGPGAGGALGLN
jgi:hypothetical protein